jgi:ADP-ribose pyrophosphatase
MTELVRFYVSPGWATEELIVYVARDIVSGTAQTEEDEDLVLETMSASEVIGQILHGDISDSKTIVGLLSWLGIKLPLD